MNPPTLAAPSPLIATRLSLMMFLEFFVWGAWYITVGNFMAAHGMGGGIAWAYSVGPIAALVSPFFLGIIADRFFSTERVLAATHLIGGAALLLAPALVPAEGGSFWPFVGMLALHMLCYMPTLGLTNSLSFHHMQSAEKQFPIVRVFGTIGWIAAGFAIAYATPWFLPRGIDLSDAKAVEAAAVASPHFFYFGGGAAILLGLYSLTLPHTPPPARGQPVSVRALLGLDSLILLRERSFLIFILSSFLLCIPLAAYYAFASVYVKQSAPGMGVTVEHVPVIMSYGQMSEIGFMLIMPLLFARLGVKWMMALGMLAWVVRYGLFSAAAHDHIRWMILAGIILHGMCYDFFFVTGFIYVDKKAPPEIRAQAQGFLVLMTQGLGLLIGAQLSGRLVAHFTSGEGAGAITDWRTVWIFPSAAAAVVFVAFLALFSQARTSVVSAGSS